MAQNSDPPQNFLSDHMAKFSGETYVEGWAGLWNNKGEDETLPWDRGYHSTALEDVLAQKKDLVGGAFLTEEADNSNRRKRALVPGCGTGYDALLLASFGYDVYGLDYSQVAVETAKKEAAKNEGQYVVRDPDVGRGKVVFVQGDFFKDDWLENLGLGLNSFDLIYDYTVCIDIIYSFILSLPRSIPSKYLFTDNLFQI
jgi:SAM-dependent methyltransferase